MWGERVHDSRNVVEDCTMTIDERLKPIIGELLASGVPLEMA